MPIAEIRRPGAIAAMPRARHSRVTSISRSASSLTRPTGIVSAESACQPSRINPMSMPTMSPSARARDEGMPCTTSSFTEMQADAGNPWYPLKLGIQPASRILASMASSSSAVVTPGATSLRTSRKTEAKISALACILST
jgi:hypothetical protein